MTRIPGTYLVLLSVLLLPSAAAEAQDPPAAQSQPAPDPLGRSTPHGAVVGLIEAAERNDLDRAAEYLESGQRLPDRKELARQLWVVLDRKLVTGLDRVSRAATGDLSDGQTDRDRIGTLRSPSGDVELFVDRAQRGGIPVWLFSSSTLESIPRLYDEVQPLWIEQFLPEWLRTTRWLSLPLYRWIALLLLVPLIFGFAALSGRVLTRALSVVLRRVSPVQPDRPLPSLGPLRLLVFALVFYAVSLLSVTLVARNFWMRVAQTLIVVSVGWLLVRLVDLVGELSVQRLQRGHRSGDVALLRLIDRLLKAAVVIVAGLVLLYQADVDLTAALTGLGVGGIAIGFGAQKTIENLFGGIMVISDKPVNVGDVCKVGEFIGTVEDIGIRSTRIRTLDRTVVAVPNGQLASMILENFEKRDRFRFQHTIGLARQTSAEQMRHVLAEVRALLAAQPKVESTSARTRLIRFGAASLDIEVLAYVVEHDQATFLAIQEELLLGIMEILASSGVSAPPAAAAPPVQVTG